MGILFRYLSSLAVIILVSVHLLGATEESELYQELKDALLTEDNIFRLQQAFYPSDNIMISDVYLYLNVTVENITDSEFSSCLAFHFDKYCWCFKRLIPYYYDNLHISSYSKNLEAYLGPYIDRYVIFFDITFFKILTAVGYKERNTYHYNVKYPNHILDINMNNLTKKSNKIYLHEYSTYAFSMGK